jgi:hypothetical protein
LRGFADYRVRAPNRELFQVEYRHTLWGTFRAAILLRHRQGCTRAL